jgi:hypothetical protein
MIFITLLDGRVYYLWKKKRSLFVKVVVIIPSAI